MKLFELFESPIISGANNLKAIAHAATTGSNAEITLGHEPVTLEYPEARFVYGLYKKALQNGQQEQFLRVLTDPMSFDKIMSQMRNMLYRDRSGEMAQAAAQRIGQPGMAEAAGYPVTENTDTMQHIVNRFKHEVRNFINGDELDTDLYHALFDYYSDHGEMPYGTMKARDGDPFEWVTQRFDHDVHQYVTESVDPEINALIEGWEDMVNAAKERAKQEKGTGKFDKKTTSTGTVYTRKYNQDSGETEEPAQDAEGNEPVKRGRGRPRKNPVAAPSDAPKRGRGRPRKNPLPDPNAPKRGRGRPKKVREWIETLRFVAEGFKNASK